MNEVILIDNGHGINTPGKCSPDKQLLEWKWTREVASMIVRALTEQGRDARLIVTEEQDIRLSDRVNRVNRVCRQRGAANVLLVSVHVNAAGSDGKWHNARGFSVWIAKTASERSKRLAKIIYGEAEQRGLKGNRFVPRERYWTANFTMVSATLCPAILTENLFQDNREDVAYLLSEEGKKTIAEMHVAAINKYLGQ